MCFNKEVFCNVSLQKGILIMKRHFLEKIPLCHDNFNTSFVKGLVIMKKLFRFWGIRNGQKNVLAMTFLLKGYRIAQFELKNWLIPFIGKWHFSVSQQRVTIVTLPNTILLSWQNFWHFVSPNTYSTVNSFHGPKNNWFKTT